MENINIRCIKNIVFSDKDKMGVAQQNIKIGEQEGIKYWSYLYFDTSEISSSCEIVQATLILYKIPIEEENLKDKFFCSCVPTKEYVSKYSYYYDKTIRIENKILMNFEFKKELVYVEVDITNMVKIWIENKLENKGIILTGKEKNSYIEFEGSGYESTGYPFLKIKYKNCSSIWTDEDEPIIKLPVNIRID